MIGSMWGSSNFKIFRAAFLKLSAEKKQCGLVWFVVFSPSLADILFYILYFIK